MVEINKSDFMGGLRPGMAGTGVSDGDGECRVDRGNVWRDSRI